MLQVIQVGRFWYIQDTSSKKWWKAYFSVYAHAVGCMCRVEEDWRSDGNKEQDLDVNFVSDRQDCYEARNHSI